VFSPSTTRVCPALLPPWKRTTTSASAARRSTIFPFPSSPHWVPVTTAAGTERLQPQHVGRDDLRELPQLRHHLRRHGIVDVDQGDRHAPDPLAAELEAGDVDAALGEELGEEPAQRGGGERPAFTLSRLGAYLDRDLERRLGQELAGERAEPLGEQQVGAEDLHPLARERRGVDRVLDGPPAEEIRHL